MAFNAAYDAMRLAVDAHMNAHGYRVESGEGGHAHRVRYAELTMTDILAKDDIAFYRASRQVRHRTEIPRAKRSDQRSHQGSIRTCNRRGQTVPPRRHCEAAPQTEDDVTNSAEILYQAQVLSGSRRAGTKHRTATSGTCGA